nr:MAG TPA: YopX protein [Caudoviricetes sp.]
MRPEFRAWDKEFKEMVQVDALILNEQVIKATYKNGNVVKEDIKNYDLMQSTGLFDNNDQEIFEGDVLKFNDEWDEYCHEGYVDGSVEGINFIEVVRGEACFEFGKTRYPESSLFIRMEDEHLTFAELIKSRDFEFEIIGNIYENPELLEEMEYENKNIK